jgi:hypothetical protein
MTAGPAAAGDVDTGAVSAGAPGVRADRRRSGRLSHLNSTEPLTSVATTAGQGSRERKSHMPDTTTATTGALDPPAVLAHGARAVVRRLAVEYAHGILDESPDVVRADEYRHVALVLLGVVEADESVSDAAADQAYTAGYATGKMHAGKPGPALARQALDEARRRPTLCGGSSTFVPADHVDGSLIATCPTCRRFRAVTAMDGCGWFVLNPHVARP